MIDGTEWLLPQRRRFSCDLQDALDLTHSTAFAHTVKPFADRSRDCGGHALTGAFRKFAGKAVSFFVFDVKAHMVPLYPNTLLFYHMEPELITFRLRGFRKGVLVLAVADDQHALARTIAHDEFESVGARIDGDE